jgi:hypothetical protein
MKWATAAASSTLVAALAAAALVEPDPAAAADPAPDFSYFKERIEPVLQTVCAQCHAGKGQGQFKLIVHAPGVPFPDAEHKVNYETVLKLVVPGKPAESKFLQKPLAERGGGVKHGGNERIFRGTDAYRAWTDFINGVKGSGSGSSAPPPAADGQPDFGFFLARIEPVLLTVCAQCHAGAGRGQFALITHGGGTRFPLADHRKNYDTVMKLLTPKKPMESRFLLKPLAEKDGGMKHGGNDRIVKGDPNYVAWVDFINGVKGPPVPAETVPEEETLPTVLDKGLVLQAEEMAARGDVAPATPEGAQGRVIAPGAAGGRLTARFRVGRTGDYALTFRVAGAARGLRVRVDGGEPMDVDVPREGWADVSPRVALDGGKPLEARLGALLVTEQGTLRMDGREGTARFLAPADLPHTKVEAKVSLPDGDDVGLVDAWLLFDCLDAENGKFAGISDGGRRFVIGVIEAGRPRVVASKPMPPDAKRETLGVDLSHGVAVARLDGKPIAFVNFDRNLGAARFGFLTHGLATVTEMSAKMGLDEVYRMRLSQGGVVHLRRGSHSLEFELMPSGAALDTATVKETAP